MGKINQKLGKLNNYIKNDMDILFDFLKNIKFKNFNCSTVCNSFLDKNKKYSKNISIEKLYKEFEGIFDPASYGLYLDGFDRNKIFKQKSINKNLFISKSAINLKNSFIKFKKIKNYKIPFLNYKNKQVKLLTLHIHSKNLKNFLSK